jgi:hypothetical protein
MTAMLAFNTSMVDAGILVSGEGLLPSSKGARVQFSSGSDTTVTNGPFEAGSLISGFWVIKAKDLDEAVAWARKAPFGQFASNDGQVLEVRQITSADDFGDLMTDELKKGEEELRKRVDG